MTELRDRLAEVMYNKYNTTEERRDTWERLLEAIEQQDPGWSLYLDLEIRDEWLAIADAVIEDLGLRESVVDADDGSAWSFTGSDGTVTTGSRAPTKYRRYISREEKVPRDDS